MKILKKLGIFMACAMFVTSFAPETAKAYEDDIDVVADNASTALAEEFEGDFEHNSKYKNPIPAFYDINQDGITEMFVYYDVGDLHTVEVFYYDYSGRYGKVVRAKKITKCSSISYSKSKKQIDVVRAASYTETADDIYSFTGKKLKKVSNYKLKYHLKSGKSTYYKNGKRISKKKYTKDMIKLSKWGRMEELFEEVYK